MSDQAVVDALKALTDEVREMRLEMRTRLLSAKNEREKQCQAIEALSETVKRIETHNIEAHDTEGARLKNAEATAARAERLAKNAHRRLNVATGGAE